jgi:beta-aspartyl-peptidase (threonine type)
MSAKIATGRMVSSPRDDRMKSAHRNTPSAGTRIVGPRANGWPDWRYNRAGRNLLASTTMNLLCVAGLCFSLSFVEQQSASKSETAKAIEAVLTRQRDAWNQGDIDAFMEHYWKSDELTFSAGGQTTRGWQATKDNYVKRYPTREEMGQLTFSQLEITPLESSAALVLGRWRLERKPEPVGGNFTLVLRRIDGRWLIIHDHTSRAEPRP